MSFLQTSVQAAAIVLVVDLMLLVSLFALKVGHRRRTRLHDARRAGHVGLLSRHLAFEHHTDPIGPVVAADPAFLDALIDVRNAVDGPEIKKLGKILGRYGITDRLIRRLQARYPLGRRIRSAVALAEIGDRSSANVLIEHLSDREPEIRVQSARGLSRMGWTPGIEAILERLRRETPWVRSHFADALVTYGRDATWPLIAYLRINHRHEPTASMAAIRSLGTIGDEESVIPLTVILHQSSEPVVVITILESLGALGNRDAYNSVRGLASHENRRIRAAAVAALGRIGDPAAIPTLRAGLEDTGFAVRRNSAASLAQISGGVESLYAALESHDPYARDAAAEALTDIGALADARSRHLQGTASRQDHLLLEHMSHPA